jgi:hypothetical protein
VVIETLFYCWLAFIAINLLGAILRVPQDD